MAGLAAGGGGGGPPCRAGGAIVEEWARVRGGAIGVALTGARTVGYPTPRRLIAPRVLTMRRRAVGALGCGVGRAWVGGRAGAGGGCGVVRYSDQFVGGSGAFGQNGDRRRGGRRAAGGVRSGVGDDVASGVGWVGQFRSGARGRGASRGRRGRGGRGRWRRRSSLGGGRGRRRFRLRGRRRRGGRWGASGG